MNPGTLIRMEASPPPQLIEPAHPSAWSGEPGTASRPHRPLLVNYWHVLVRRKGIILFSLLVALFLDTLATLKMTRLYEAVGHVAVSRENSDVLGLKETAASAGDYWDYTVALETHVKLLQGDMLALQVIKELGLDSNPYFARRKPRRTAEAKVSVTPSNLPEPSTTEEAALLEAFHRALTVTVLPRTQIIEIRFLSPDPRTAAQVVNALANAYIERNFQTKYESTMQASNWLSKQLADLETKMELSQEKMVRYQRENGIVAVDEKQNIVTAKLEQLNRELTAAEGDRIQKEANYVLVQTGSAELASKVDPTSLIEKLRGQQVELQNQYAQTTTRFDSSYPRVRELSNQLGQINEAIQAEIARLAERSKNEYLAAAHREKKLRAALEAQKQEQNRMNESAIQFTILKHDADSNRQLYEGLSQKLKGAGITAGLKSNDTRITGVARVPAKPVRPDIPRNIALGLLLGVVGGVALAFTLESLDNTVRTLEQVQTISALPCLGFIPAMDLKLNGNERRRLPELTSPRRQDQEAGVELTSLSQPQSEIAEAFRAFRTSLLLSSAGTPPQMILFTSAVSKEGKTTASINCAVVLAQKGERVLLVDADLRQPSVHQRLGIAPTPGLSTLLNGCAETQGVIARAPQLCNLFVLPAGAASSQPAELLGSQAMKRFLAKCRKQFDHIIIDSPPVLAVTDAVVLSVAADAVILVARSEVTRKEALLRARDVLLGVNARLSGVLLNAVNLRSPDLYGYSYSYEYKYSGRRGSDQQGTSADNGNQVTDPESLADPKCSHCGTTLPAIAKFCAECGHAVMSGEPARGAALSTGTVLWSEAISRLAQQLAGARTSDQLVPQAGPVHPNCGAVLRAAVASCTECGRPALCRVRCQGCNSELEEGARFCIECGAKAAWNRGPANPS